MKAVFVYPKIENIFMSSNAPLGIMSIASYLNANGHEAIIYDRFVSKKSIADVLNEFKPDIVGISVIALSYLNDAMKVAEAVKAEHIPVVFGGIVSSSLPKEILDGGYADYVSINEGEYTWLEMANAFDANLPFDDIKGLAYIKNSEYCRTEDRELIDLSTLPDLDWSLVETEKYFQINYGCKRMLVTYTSKGCPNRCSYCYNPVFNRSKNRKRPLQQVINEMKMLVEKYGADGFDFTDDSLFITRNEMIEFCEAIKASGLDIRFSHYLSIGILNTPEDFKILYDAGCRTIFFGIESGSEKTLKALNKKLKPDLVKSNIDCCIQANIVPIPAFLLGVPGEDEEDLRATIALAKSLNGASVVYNFYTPLPSSRLYDELIADGRLEKLTDLRDFAKIKVFEGFYKNLSAVPTSDLLTIRRFIRLRTMTSNVGGTKNGQLTKIITSNLRSWSSRGVIGFFRSAFNAAMTILDALTLFLHPKIRKKYDLYFN